MSIHALLTFSHRNKDHEMPRLLSLFCLFLTLIAGPAFADSNAPTELAGNWTSQSHSGVFTQLKIEDNGRFVYRQLHSADLRRSYKCGALTDAGDALNLEIKQNKERSADGAIAQAAGTQSERIVIRSRSANRLVVTIDAETVVLERNG